MKTAVVIAVYNGAAYLKEQLESIIEQSRQPDFILIRDDGSNDESAALIEQFIQEYPETDIRLMQGENLGFRQNFRLLLESCDADWVFLSDQDDRWHPERMERMLETIKAHPEIGLLASSFEFMNQNSQVYHVIQKNGWSNQNLIPRSIHAGSLEKISLDELIFHNYFQGCSMAASREIIQDYLSSDNPDLPHDWMLSLCAARKYSLFFLNEPLFDYRIHQDNTIGLPQGSRFTLFQRLKTINSERNRTIVLKQSKDVLNTIKNNFPESWDEEKQNLAAFAGQALDALAKKKAGAVIALMKNPDFSKFKSRAGQWMDVFYCLSRRFS